MIRYAYNYEGILIDCLLEYTEAVRGARERNSGGLPLEPDYPASTELIEARVGGIDILPLLSRAQIDSIEWEALQCC